MAFLDWLLGRPLSSEEEEQQHIGLLAGVPVLGLDGLSSAAYGPEALLTVLLPLGVLGLSYVGPITALIVGILLVVYISYRQTISAYPGGGGSYTVAKENLGQGVGLLAGSALALDYVLNVAVGVAAGVGALVSAIPSLLPHTLALCLVILAALTVVNLRGIREASAVFALPTYSFVLMLGAVVVVGVIKSALNQGHPLPIAAPPTPGLPIQAVSLWLLTRAFASGCTAMTGIEAVSNAVPIFRKPAVQVAQRTLTAIVLLLATLLVGIAYLCRAYGIIATEPGEAGYQSILSMLVGAIVGRGALYYVVIGSVVAVLALSANTSFADFPRLCRILAIDRFLPGFFAVRGRRLVFTPGILLLAVLSGALLIGFDGITDRLIPLFAIGAFLAFTLSQAGMVQHWRKLGALKNRGALVLNAVGALGTGLTLVVVVISKFTQGAWVSIAAVLVLVTVFLRVKRHYEWVASRIETIAPLEMPPARPPIAVLAAGSWNRMTQLGLKFALRLTEEVYVVQVKTETGATEDLSDNWGLLIASPAHEAQIRQPKLVILTSDYRQFFKPFVDFVVKLSNDNPDRDIVVVIPDLVMNHWYEGILHNNRGAFLRSLLRTRCSSRVVVVNTPFYLKG